MPLSIDQFLGRLSDSALLDCAAVELLIQDMPEGERPSDGEQLARLLVQRKMLTAYQAKQVYAGKGQRLVLGNYVILDRLGQGGMGVVFKAEHRRMSRIVALKVLSPEFARTPEALRRFQREVKAAARLDHPNIVTSHDADEADDVHFLVMQFVDGKDLSEVVRTEGPLPVQRALDYILQAAQGLEYAHRLGVVHRDVKPSNLLLAGDNTVKLLDLGLARLQGPAAAECDLTTTGAVMGTVDFMAPEQALNTKDADERSDIYSLGMTLWYLLTGRPPYDADSVVARLLAHRESPIPKLEDFRPEISEEIADLFCRMVAKRPDARFQCMTDVIRAIAGCQTESTSNQPRDRARMDAARYDSAVAESHLAEREPTVAAAAPPITQQPAAGERPTLARDQSDLATDPKTLTLLASAPRVAAQDATPRKRHIAGTRGALVAVAAAVAVPILAAAIIFSLPGHRSPSDSGASSRPATSSTASPRPDEIGAMHKPVHRGDQAESKITGQKPNDALRGAGSPAADLPNPSPGEPPRRFALDFSPKLADGYARVALPFTYPEDWQFTVELYATIASLAPRSVNRGIVYSNEFQLKQTFKGLELVHVREDKSIDQVVFAAIESGKRMHIAAVSDGTEMRLYVKGALVGATPLRRDFARQSTIVIGSLYMEHINWSPFYGTIEQLRISRGVRYTADFSPAERFEVEPDTIALYRFDEGSGDVLRDATEDARHGTIIGALWVPLGAPQSHDTPP